jgi:hypothetical protein
MPLWFEITVLLLLGWIGSSLYLIYAHLNGLRGGILERLERITDILRDHQRN